MDGKTLLYVGYDGKLLGTIGMRDRVRENAKETLKQLKRSGCQKTCYAYGRYRVQSEFTCKRTWDR